MEEIPHLDLYNFFEPAASESPYVLTSPRSLQACARFGIKPMNLLPQSLEEFEEEYAGVEDVYIAFKRREKDRLKCLHLCREEREKIIDSLEKNSDNGDNDGDVGDVGDNNDGITDEEEENKYKWNTLKHDVDEYEEMNDTSGEEEVPNPDILSFLKAKRHFTPRSQVNPMLMNFGSDSSEEDEGVISTRGGGTPKGISSFNILNGSDDNSYEDSDFEVRPTSIVSPKLSRQRSRNTWESAGSTGNITNKSNGTNYETNAKKFHHVNNYESFPKSFSDGTKNKLSRRKPSSRKKAGDEFNMDDIAEQLPKHLRTNLSQMSSTDKKLLKSMMSKASEDQQQQSHISFDSGRPQSSHRNVLEKLKQRERRLNEILLRQKHFGSDVDDNDEFESSSLKITGHQWRTQSKPKSSSSLLKQENQRHQMRQNDVEDEVLSPHFTQSENTSYGRRPKQSELLEDIEYKHEKAALQFQHLMKEKDQKRNIKSAKERERKERQEKHVQDLEKDLTSWQQELKDFQDLNEKRAEQKVQKRNLNKSEKAHNKRLQRELDHLQTKERLNKHDEERREELRALIAMKDERSNLIQNEKQEYKKMSQDAARASRAVRDIIKEKTIKSSFDKMAAEAERAARIEKLGRNSSHRNPTQTNRKSSLHLG